MKAALLEQIVADRAAKRTVVLVTDLQSGNQRLLYPISTDAESAPGPDNGVPVDDLLIEGARVAARDDRSGVVGHQGRKLLLDVFNPPVRVVVVGAAHIAQALVALATLNGYEVVVVDPRRAFATVDRFPEVEMRREWPQRALPELRIDHRTAVVVLSHDPKIDDPALEHAVTTPAFYIGALGSKRNHAARMERLAEAGCDGAALARVHGPIGLDIGARTPAEIATAILSQLIEQLRKRRRS